MASTTNLFNIFVHIIKYDITVYNLIPLNNLEEKIGKICRTSSASLITTSVLRNLLDNFNSASTLQSVEIHINLNLRAIGYLILYD